ncbi:hypothetical protein ACWEQ4_18790 [Rhodococcus sp. NPDC003994]
MSGMDALGAWVESARDVGAHVIDRAGVALSDLLTGDDSERLAAGERALARYRDLDGTVAGPTGAPGGVVPEAFEAMSHPAIWGHAVELTPAMLDAGAETWRMAHERLAAAVTTLWHDLEAVLGTDWQGMAADAALAAVATYRDRSTASVDLMGAVSAELDVARHGLAATRENVPPPQSFTPSDFARVALASAALNPFASVQSVTSLFAEEEERRAAAVAVMNTVYVPTVLRADGAAPVLPPPVDPAPGGSGAGVGLGGVGLESVGLGGVEHGTSTLSGTGGVVGSTTSGPADTVAAAGAGQSAGPAAVDGTGAGTPGVADRAGASTGPTPTAGGGPGGVLPGRLGASESAPVRAASSSSAGAPRDRPGIGGPGVGRGGVGGGGVGSDGGAAHPDGPGSRILGERVVGPAGTGAAASPAPGSSGAAAVGRGGMYGPAAMMPGRGGADDSEHRPASYLVTADNGDALVGDLPLVAPPVIG